MMKKTSLFIDAPVVKRGRKLGTILLDFVIEVLLTLFLLFGIDMVVSSAGGQKGVTESIASNETLLKELIRETHLEEFDSFGNPRGVPFDANQYILRLTYGSLLHNGKSEEELSGKTYAGIAAINEENEFCYHYYSIYKIDKNSDFLQGYRDNSGLNYYRSILTEGFEGVYAEEGFPYLTKENAEKIDEGFRNPRYSEGINLRTNLQSHYENLLKDAVKDFEKGYGPYVEARKAYEESYRSLWLIKLAEAFGGYLLSTLILFLLLPLLFKNGRTLSGRFLRLPYKRVDGDEARWTNVSIKALVLLLEYVCAPILSLLFTYGAGAKEILSLTILGIPMFSVLIYSVILMLISYILTFLPRGKRQTLSELTSRLIQVDGKDIAEG